MSKKFKCHHCGQQIVGNPRIKSGQKYCGAKACQQARKNAWERKKCKTDATYKAKRASSKRNWYSKYPGDKYQSEYRRSHPDYCEKNRQNQHGHKQKRSNRTSEATIVKTDTSPLESVDTQGLYALIPYKGADGKKIVKTDALIVQMVDIQSVGCNFLSKSG